MEQNKRNHEYGLTCNLYLCCICGVTLDASIKRIFETRIHIAQGHDQYDNDTSPFTKYIRLLICLLSLGMQTFYHFLDIYIFRFEIRLKTKLSFKSFGHDLFSSDSKTCLQKYDNLRHC